MNKDQLSRDLAHVLNCHSIDNALDTPDFIVSDMLVEQLSAMIAAHEAVKRWRGEDEQHPEYGIQLEPNPEAEAANATRIN